MSNYYPWILAKDKDDLNYWYRETIEGDHDEETYDEPTDKVVQSLENYNPEKFQWTEIHDSFYDSLIDSNVGVKQYDLSVVSKFKYADLLWDPKEKYAPLEALV